MENIRYTYDETEKVKALWASTIRMAYDDIILGIKEINAYNKTGKQFKTKQSYYTKILFELNTAMKFIFNDNHIISNMKSTDIVEWILDQDIKDIRQYTIKQLKNNLSKEEYSLFEKYLQNIKKGLSCQWKS